MLYSDPGGLPESHHRLTRTLCLGAIRGECPLLRSDLGGLLEWLHDLTQALCLGTYERRMSLAVQRSRWSAKVAPSFNTDLVFGCL